MKLSKAHYEYMNIGRRFWDANVFNLRPSQKEAVKDYVKRFKFFISKGVGLFLWGPNSSGKTYVSASLLILAWERWLVSGYCVTAASLKENFVKDMPVDFGSEETVITRAIRSQILVIDDLGREHRSTSGFAENRFDMLLRDRSRDLNTTIITSNLNPDDFRDIYGVSSFELVRENMHFVKLNGENIRAIKECGLNRFLNQ